MEIENISTARSDGGIQNENGSRLRKRQSCARRGIDFGKDPHLPHLHDSDPGPGSGLLDSGAEMKKGYYGNCYYCNHNRTNSLECRAHDRAAEKAYEGPELSRRLRFLQNARHHDQSEVVFYIISGEGTLRTCDGKKWLRLVMSCVSPAARKGCTAFPIVQKPNRLCILTLARAAGQISFLIPTRDLPMCMASILILGPPFRNNLQCMV